MAVAIARSQTTAATQIVRADRRILVSEPWSERHPDRVSAEAPAAFGRHDETHRPELKVREDVRSRRIDIDFAPPNGAVQSAPPHGPDQRAGQAETTGGRAEKVFVLRVRLGNCFPRAGIPRGSARTRRLLRPLLPLFRSVESIAEVAEARNDELALVQVAVRRGEEGRLRVA